MWQIVATIELGEKREVKVLLRQEKEKTICEN